MSLRKIYELLLGYDDPDIPIKKKPLIPIVEKPVYHYPVSESEALSIADKKLTKVYMKNWDGGIPTYVSLFLEVDGVVTKNNRKYYHIKCTGGDISGADNGTLWDGEVSKKGAKKLQCLIDVENGKYIYIGDKHIE